VLGVKAIFVNTTINPTLAKQVAADSGIRLVPLYAESLGEAGSGVETYIDFIRYNTTAIVEALR
jgi:ABC-type Zn uptake system ZnuABC Zn-binding protein ZnuA